MLFKKKHKTRLVYGVFAVKDNQKYLVGLYQDERNARQCAKGVRENTNLRAITRSIGIDF